MDRWGGEKGKPCCALRGKGPSSLKKKARKGGVRGGKGGRNPLSPNRETAERKKIKRVDPKRDILRRERESLRSGKKEVSSSECNSRHP